MGKSLDIGYALAKENMVFQKYPAIHELETRRGVEEACQLISTNGILGSILVTTTVIYM